MVASLGAELEVSYSGYVVDPGHTTEHSMWDSRTIVLYLNNLPVFARV